MRLVQYLLINFAAFAKDTILVAGRHIDVIKYLNAERGLSSDFTVNYQRQQT